MLSCCFRGHSKHNIRVEERSVAISWYLTLQKMAIFLFNEDDAHNPVDSLLFT